jgi:Kef-type K+ transport system membrane component KefB
MPEQLPLMLILLILLLFSKVFGELFERFGIPALTGEILGGLILGPTVLGLVKDSHEIRAIADLGVLMLIVMAGLEIRGSEVRTALKGKNIWTAILGFIVPGAGGYLLGHLFGFDTLFNIFLGLCLAISALPVSIRILMDLGKLHTDIGQLIISTAIINDILSLLFLGIMLDVKDQPVLSAEFGMTLLKNLLRVLIFYDLPDRDLPHFPDRAQQGGHRFSKTEPFPGVAEGQRVPVRYLHDLCPGLFRACRDHGAPFRDRRFLRRDPDPEGTVPQRRL